MKFFLIAVIVIEAAFLVNADLSDEQKKKIIVNGKQCKVETDVPLELIEKAREGTFSDDPKLKAFAFCMSKKIGFQNTAGEIQPDVVRQKLSTALAPEVVNQLVEKCAVPKGSGEETAYQSFICYRETSPTKLTVF